METIISIIVGLYVGGSVAYILRLRKQIRNADIAVRATAKTLIRAQEAIGHFAKIQKGYVPVDPLDLDIDKIKESENGIL